MTLSKVSAMLECETFVPESPEQPVPIRFGCASDLMSDVLAFSRSGSVLLTGLVAPQTIQTAVIAEVSAVIFVRGKRPGGEVITLARQQGMPLLSTPCSMYEACGRLFGDGLPSTMERLAGCPQDRNG
jgi:hypothetical protein